MRSPKEWQLYAERNISGGYVAGSDKTKFYQHALTLLTDIRRVVDDSAFVGREILDLGCGNGRLPIVLDGEGIPLESYTGIDVQTPSVQFCRNAFSASPIHSFHLSRAYNKRYAPKNRTNKPSLPLNDGSIDFAVANSFFTHTATIPIADHYLAELHRVMRPGAILYSTWFRNPPHPLSTEASKTVYKESDIRSLLNRFEWVTDIFGKTTGRIDQWRIVVRK